MLEKKEARDGEDEREIKRERKRERVEGEKKKENKNWKVKDRDKTHRYASCNDLVIILVLHEEKKSTLSFISCIYSKGISSVYA